MKKKLMLSFIFLLLCSGAKADIISFEASRSISSDFEPVRESITSSWMTWISEQNDTVLIASGEQTYNECQYIYENALVQSHWNNDDGVHNYHQTFINYILGPDTTADQNYCHDNSRHWVEDGEFVYLFTNTFFLYLDEMTPTNGSINLIGIDEGKLGNFPAYRVRFRTDLRDPSVLPEKLAKKMNFTEFKGELHILFATSVPGSAAVINSRYVGQVDGQSIDETFPIVLKINNSSVKH